MCRRLQTHSWISVRIAFSFTAKHLNVLYAVMPSFVKIHCNIISPSTSRSPNWSHTFVQCDKLFFFFCIYPCLINKSINTYIPTNIHTLMHTYIHTYTHTCMHTYTHTYIHTYIHTHTHIHTYIHTYHTRT